MTMSAMAVVDERQPDEDTDTERVPSPSDFITFLQDLTYWDRIRRLLPATVTAP